MSRGYLESLVARECVRQHETLALVASSSHCDARIRRLSGSVFASVTAEGYPGARYHPGTSVADELEAYAIAQAKTVFRARYANVQPHSGSSANVAVMLSLLKPGDRILGMRIDAGGHLTHGAKASFSGNVFRAAGYGLVNGQIDYDEVEEIALAQRPKMIVCGASAYPRTIDFARFRQIADRVDAILLADISHIAGLVAAGAYPSPIDCAHVTTTSTYKQLYGPRGGLILSGKEADCVPPGHRRPLIDSLQRSIFPFTQGTPDLAGIAGKAGCLEAARTPIFYRRMITVLDLARILGEQLTRCGYQLVTGGTDTHMLLVDLRDRGLSGDVAEKALEACGILVNKNLVDQDPRPPRIASGIRLGTNTLACRGLTRRDIVELVAIIDQILRSIGVISDTEYRLPASLQEETQALIANLCRRRPLPE